MSESQNQGQTSGGEGGTPSNFEYGEVPISASVHSSQRATPDQLIALGKKIWEEVRRSKVKKNDDTGNDKLLEVFQTKYKDFNLSFPIVLRWMVQRREFHAGAFNKFLLKHAHADLKTREAFLELQGDYLGLLYRETHPHYNEEFAQRYHREVTKQLLEEDKLFTETQKQVEIDFDEKAKAFAADRRQRLHTYLLAQKVAREKTEVNAPASTVDVISEAIASQSLAETGEAPDSSSIDT